MIQSERFRLAQYLYNRGKSLEEIKVAIEMVELSPISQDDWQAIVIFIKE